MAKKNFNLSLIDAAIIVYCINLVTGIDVVKLVGDLLGGKANLKTYMTSGVTTAIKKIQADPLNIVLTAGIAILIATMAHKVFGRKKIVGFGGFNLTL